MESNSNRFKVFISKHKLSAIALLAAFTIITVFFRENLLIWTIGVPFTPSEYKELLANDRQTPRGFRKEWADAIDTGDLGKMIRAGRDKKKADLAIRVIESEFRYSEKILRNINDEKMAIKYANDYGDYLKCLEVLGYDFIKVSDAQESAIGDKVSAAMRYIERFLKFKIFDSSRLETEEDCRGKYK